MNPWGGRSGTRKRRESPAALESASALRYPARTAPSMVEGHPVAVQSPLRNSRGQGLAGESRYCVAERRGSEGGVNFLDHGRLQQLRFAHRRERTLPTPSCASSMICRAAHLQQTFRRAHDQFQVAAVCAVCGGLRVRIFDF